MLMDGQLYCKGCGGHIGPHTHKAGKPKELCPQCRERWRWLYMLAYRQNPNKKRKLNSYQRRWRAKVKKEKEDAKSRGNTE